MQRISITNSKKEKMIFALEPWGEQFEMQPEESFGFEYSGPNGPTYSLDIQEYCISLWVGGQYDFFRLYRGDVVLSES